MTKKTCRTIYQTAYDAWLPVYRAVARARYPRSKADRQARFEAKQAARAEMLNTKGCDSRLR